MKNIETAIEAIEAEKKLELEKLIVYDDLIERMKKLKDGDYDSVTEQHDNLTSPGNDRNVKDAKDLFKDYPRDQKLSAKLHYLDSVLKRPFRAFDRLEIIEQLEGKEKRMENEGKISQQLNSMIHNMTYIAQKYGSNPKTFYFKVDWATFNGKEYTIKPEYEITLAEFEAAGIPEQKRKDFDWIISKAVKALLATNNSGQ